MATTHAGGLIAELSRRAVREGGNTGVWPGLTIYRFTAPVGPTWEEIQSLSLCIVAQGRKAVTADGATYEYDPGAALRLLGSIDTGAGRRVLAPMYLREMAYRVPQREQYSRLLAIGHARGRVRQRVALHQRVPRPVRRHPAHLQRLARAAPGAARPAGRPDRCVRRSRCNSAGPRHYLAGTRYAKWNGQ